ncbi:MAG TPA: rod shape-determining protein MreD [Gemmatimonadales bacterium]|nr:rod shape-determining protein MreD [Gemmatimonadales bacterium]
MSSVWTGEGPTRRRKSDRLRISIVVVILLLLEFYLRPSLIQGRGMPDFLLLALWILCLRLPPGWAAVVGLVVGATIDILSPARFGANMIAHVLLGFTAAWGRAVFFADHVIVNAGLFFVGTWLRNIMVLALSGAALGTLTAEALVWGPVQGLTTALVGTVIVILFRDWLAIRVER